MAALRLRLQRIDAGLETCDWVIRTLSPVRLYPDNEINLIVQRRKDLRSRLLTCRVKVLTKILHCREALFLSGPAKTDCSSVSGRR